MPQETIRDLSTEVQDLSKVTISDLRRQDSAGFADTARQLLDRANHPGRSVSGYNPQRLD
jgi:hypothetical protein